MARDVEQVEAAVTEEVVGVILSDLKRRIEVDLADIAASSEALVLAGSVMVRYSLKITFQHGRLIVLRVSWHKLLPEARTYDQVRLAGEF